MQCGLPVAPLFMLDSLDSRNQSEVAEYHRFLLTQELTHLDFLDEQIALVDREIERRIQA